MKVKEIKPYLHKIVKLQLKRDDIFRKFVIGQFGYTYKNNKIIGMKNLIFVLVLTSLPAGKVKANCVTAIAKMLNKIFNFFILF